MTVSIFLREEACHCHGQPKRGKDCKPVPLRRLAEGSSSLRHQQRQSRTNLWIFRDFGFLWCLSHWQHPFLLVYPNFKNKKQFRLSSLHSLLPELWSLIFFFFFPFGNHLHENPRLPTTPFSLFYFMFCLSPSSHVLLSRRTVNGQVRLWFGITEFFPCVCPRAARMWDKSPYNGRAPIVCTV